MNANRILSLFIGVILGIFSPALTTVAGAAGGSSEGFDERGEWSDPTLSQTTLPQPTDVSGGAAGVFRSSAAADEISPGWGVYEDWSSPFIRSDRWIVVTGRAHEARREVLDRHLLMRYRLEGSTLSNTGLTAADQYIRAANPSAIRMIDADFQVQRYTVVGCEENPLGTRVRPVQISLPGFNDGTSPGSGDMTGDHFMRIMVNREAFTVDPPRMLTVSAFLFRCINATCSNAISSIFNLDMGKVMVGAPFSLRVIREGREEHHRFRVGFNNNPDVILEYDPNLNQGPMVVPFADIRMQSVDANCIAGPTVTDSEIKVREIRMNASAVIP